MYGMEATTLVIVKSTCWNPTPLSRSTLRYRRVSRLKYLLTEVEMLVRVDAAELVEAC